jgi:site-specific recombinase XerD
MNDFTEYLQKKGFVKTTQKSTKRIVNDFFKLCQCEAINTEKKDILKYIKQLRKEGKQDTTINICLRSLRYYFDFLHENGQIGSNPTNLIKLRGIKRRKLHRIFTAEELSQLIDDYYNVFIRNFNENTIPKSLRQYSYLSRHRNYCMLSFLVYQGLHTNELENITMDNIDLIKATVKIQGTSRTNARSLKLDAVQIGALMHYFQNIRPQLLEQYTEASDLVFLHAAKPNCTITKGKYDGIYNHIKKQLQSINAEFTKLQQIRASVITHWIQNEGLRKAQYYAGHRYTSSTENYLPNDIAQLSEDIEKYNPF